MQVLEITEDQEEFAQNAMDVIHGLFSRHVEVDFESQIAIMGVAIGAILHQLPIKDRKYFSKLLIRNVNAAPRFSEVILLH